MPDIDPNILSKQVSIERLKYVLEHYTVSTGGSSGDIFDSSQYDAKIQRLETLIHNLESELSADMSSLTEAVNTHNFEVHNKIEEINQAIEDLNQTSTQVGGLSTKIDSINTEIEKINNTISELETSMGNSIDGLKQDIESSVTEKINNATTGLTSSINNLSEEINTTNESVEALQQDLSGKADAEHTHEEYALVGHDHNDLYAVIYHDHNNVYALLNHDHNDLYAEKIHTHDDATIESPGFMSIADKKKLDSISADANKVTIDDNLDPESTNPVQNKAIKTALDNKADVEHTHDDLYAGKTHTHEEYALVEHDHDGVYADRNHTHEDATAGTSGFMSAADKNKLEGIANNANNTTVDETLLEDSGNPVQNKVIKLALDGKANADHLHTEYANKDHTHEIASDTTAGFMSADDKKKLNGLDPEASKVIVDTELSDQSENPVQNKVIKSELDKKADVDHTHEEYAEANHIHENASNATDGFMSSTDKVKLDKIVAATTEEIDQYFKEYLK